MSNIYRTVDFESIGNGMDHYQRLAESTAIYPPDYRITYPIMGLVGEVGEFANKYKKVIRDGTEFTQEDMKKELGDILWYIAVLADDCNISFGDLAIANIEKLLDRQQRGVLGGSGDNR